MNIKALIYLLINQYFIIYTGSMVATYCFCIIFYPGNELPVSYLAEMLLFTLCGTLPGFVFYSPRELTETQWRVRMWIHIGLLEGVLLTAGKILGLYEGIKEGFWFAVAILGVYILVRSITYLLDQRTAKELNEKLKERRQNTGQ